MPTFDEIQAFHEADSAEDTQYVVRKNNIIVALRLRLMMNPKATGVPAEVWVGDGPIVKEWGKRLFCKRGPVRLYVARTNETEEYEDLGMYKVLRREHTPTELSHAQSLVSHGLSRIVFLEKMRGRDNRG